MKKALIYGLSAALLLASLTACGKSQTDQQTTEPEPPQIQATIPEVETTPEPEPEQTPAAPEPLSETVPVESDETEDSQTPEETAPPELFTEVNETVYAISEVNIRASYTAESEKLGSLSTGDAVNRTGIGKGEADGWSRVSLSDGSVAFINNSYLSINKPAVQQQQASGGSGKSGGQSGGQTQQTQPSVQTLAPAPATTPASSGSNNSLDEFLKESGMTKEQAAAVGKPISEEEQRAMTTNGWTANYR